MGKSVFIKNLNNSTAQRMQMRRLQDVLGNGLGVEGPCSDRREALDGLAGEVYRRIQFGSSPNNIMAALWTCWPQNIYHEESSWIQIPFLFGTRKLGNAEQGTAGDLASSAAVERDGNKNRILDDEEFLLVLLAVLRRVGTKCYYAYIHHDRGTIMETVTRILKSMTGPEGLLPNIIFRESMPCLFIPEQDPKLIILKQQQLVPFSYTSPETNVEVLDDDALQALFKIKLAHAKTKTLMRGIADEDPEYKAGGEYMAIEIGHTLDDGLSLWNPKQARKDAEHSSSLLRISSDSLRSIREMVESESIHELTCPTGHATAAAEAILEDDIPDGILEDTERLLTGNFDTGVVQDILERMEEYPSVIRFMEYMRLASLMHNHIHDSEGCDILNTAQQN